MAEPLAATLLSGAVLAMLWAADARRRASRGRWAARRASLLGALALIRPEYLAVCLSCSLLVRASPATASGRAGGRSLAPGGGDARSPASALVVAPWTVRNAIALDRFVPISTGGGQVLFAGSYLPSGGDPERVGARGRSRAPPGTAVEPRGDLPTGCALEQILAALAAQRYPGMETDEALARMGREQPLGRRHRRAARIRRLPRRQGRPDLVPRAARRDARAALGGPALGAARLRPARARSSLAWRRRWEALAAGHDLPLDHRDQRRCWSPRRGGRW